MIHDGQPTMYNLCYSKGKCDSIGCCQWDDNYCWSAVGQNPCMRNKGHRDSGFTRSENIRGSRGNGEQVCEGYGYNQRECETIGCCQWDDSDCWSAVGQGPCRN